MRARSPVDIAFTDGSGKAPVKLMESPGDSGKPPRWTVDPIAGTGWTADDPKAPKTFTHSGDGFGWVRYQHLMPPPTQLSRKRDRGEGMPRIAERRHQQPQLSI